MNNFQNHILHTREDKMTVNPSTKKCRALISYEKEQHMMKAKISLKYKQFFCFISELSKSFVYKIESVVEGQMKDTMKK